MKNDTLTTLDISDLDLITGGLDFGPAKRILGRGVENGATAAVYGFTGGGLFGGTVGLFGGPATAAAGAGIGATVGTVGGAVGGFTHGVATQAYREFRR